MIFYHSTGGGEKSEANSFQESNPKECEKQIVKSQQSWYHL
jgi:hypothetical protein